MNSITEKPWGSFEILNSGKKFLVKKIFVTKGAIHRMANKRDRDLVIIEMWYGDNLDENDIKRYEDIYERI